MTDVRCDRCGEANTAGSAFCANCGLGLPGSTAGGPPEGPAPDVTSEAVRAPQFGETGPPSVTGAPPTAAPAPGPPSPPPPSAPPPSAPPSSAPPTEVQTPAYGVTVPNAVAAPSSAEFVTAPQGGSGRSTSVMIAALVVATVVLVGGALILVLSGGDDQETADSIVAPEATTDPDATVAETPPTEALATSTEVATTVAATTVAPTAVAETLAATLPPSTPPPVTVPPPPPPTAAPPPPSVAVPPPATVRGPGDLGLPQPILNEACDGRYITFVGSAVGDRPYPEVVAQLLATYPGSNYIWTKSCPSLRQVFRDGNDIYGVVFGPYATVGEACDARRAGPPDAYVRRISTTDPQDHMIDC